MVQVPPRSHPSYDILRDMKKLEEHRGNLVQLPQLGPRTNPPLDALEYAGNSNPIPLVVTDEFIKQAKRFHTEMELEQDDVAHPGYGMVLQGPRGGGACSLGFLLMSMAYANNCVVMYAVRNGET